MRQLPNQCHSDESHSRAYNIAQAGGLYDVSDKYVPRENYESLQFAGSAATNSLLFTSSFGANLDLTSGLGLGLVTSLLEQPDTASRNSVIAWMPKSEASSTKNAQEKLLSEMKTTIESTLEEMGLEYEATNGNSERKVEFYFHSEEYGCPIYKPGMTNVDLCYIATEVFEPREAKNFLALSESMKLIRMLLNQTTVFTTTDSELLPAKVAMSQATKYIHL